jgi:hypothetical protein
MRSVAAVIASSLALSACGAAKQEDKFSGEQANVAKVISQLQSDGEKRKPDDICSKLLAKALQDKIAAAGSNCAAEMKKAIEDADTFKLDVQSVKITGDNATAIVKGTDHGKGVLRTFTFARDGGTWKITSFGS